MEVKLVFHITGTTEFEGIGEEVQTKKISVPTRLEKDEGSCIMRTVMICTALDHIKEDERGGRVLQDLARRGLHAGF